MSRNACGIALAVKVRPEYTALTLFGRQSRKRSLRYARKMCTINYLTTQSYSRVYIHMYCIYRIRITVGEQLELDDDDAVGRARHHRRNLDCFRLICGHRGRSFYPAIRGSPLDALSTVRCGLSGFNSFIMAREPSICGRKPVSIRTIRGDHVRDA